MKRRKIKRIVVTTASSKSTTGKSDEELYDLACRYCKWMENLKEIERIKSRIPEESYHGSIFNLIELLTKGHISHLYELLNGREDELVEVCRRIKRY